jgi:hypothetical protein
MRFMKLESYKSQFHPHLRKKFSFYSDWAAPANPDFTSSVLQRVQIQWWKTSGKRINLWKIAKEKKEEGTMRSPISNRD